MEFNTVSMVKHPVGDVWTSMRDELPRLADHMDDIERICVESSRQNGSVFRVVNVWQAAPKLPSNIASHLDPEMFCWTDHAEWQESEQECRWRIEHHLFGDSFSCAGRTQFKPAMGGRGTRITFSGTFELNRKKLPQVLSVLEDPVLKIVESMLIKLIPKNFQKITAAIDKHLDVSAISLNRNQMPVKTTVSPPDDRA